MEAQADPYPPAAGAPASLLASGPAMLQANGWDVEQLLARALPLG